jgi:hypothetical protein
MAIEKLKINNRPKNRTWTSPQIKNHKKSHKLGLIRPQTQHKNRRHVFKIFDTTSTICGENYESSSQIQ